MPRFVEYGKPDQMHRSGNEIVIIQLVYQLIVYQAARHNPSRHIGVMSCYVHELSM
jgi:hypothetical protein